MTDITIPDEVVKISLEAFALASNLGILPDDELDEDWREDLVNGMTAALRAGLAAWPGMFPTEMEEAAGVRRRIILPLPQDQQP